MFKHRLMLSAAATAMLATPAYATTCAPAATGTTITTVGTAPIETCTDGNIVINSGGGVKLDKQTGTVNPDVKINDDDPTRNSINNSGTLTNTNAIGAVGILIDASGAATTANSPGVENEGTIDLSGSGTNKIGIELSGINPWTGNISTVSGASIIKIVGDHSTAVEIGSTSTLIGELNLDGNISVAPTSGDNATTPSGNSLVDILGVVKGNVTIGSTAAFVGTGDGVEGIVLGSGGSIQANGGDAGSLINDGSISLTRNVTTTGTKPEGGTALFVEGGVAGGILNNGPQTSAGTGTEGVLSSSGGQGASAVAPVVFIENLTSADMTIGALPSAADATNASFSNRGAITALPNNDDTSTMAFEIAGTSSGRAILSGGFFSSGSINAQTSTKTLQTIQSTAIYIGDYATVTHGITISGGTTNAGSVNALGFVQAAVSGIGGVAKAILIAPNAIVPSISVTQYGKLLAVATTSTPTTTSTLAAYAIQDFSGTLATINNAGTIAASGTTLANPTVGVVGIFHAIDLTNDSANNITINDAGTIAGDVLLNGIGTGAVVNIGAGSATGGASFSTQNTSAVSAATAAGLTNSAAAGMQALISGNLTFGSASAGAHDKLYINDYGTYQGQLTSPSGYLDVGVSQFGTLDLTNKTVPLLLTDLNTADGTDGVHAKLDVTTSEEFRTASIPESAITAIAGGEITLGTKTALGIAIGSYVPQATAANGCASGCQYVLMQTPSGMLSIADATVISDAKSAFFSQYPWFFDPSSSLTLVSPGGGAPDQLILNLKAKSPHDLGLSGEALTMFGPASTALLFKDPHNQNLSDDLLGQAVIDSSTNATTTQQVFSQFAPDVSGDVRAVAIALTDEATGPVAARQRQLRMYANQEGDFTLWGQEFAQYINDKAKASDGEIVNYKDHGFGFVLGIDMGDPKDGWYGGALTFFAGDATEQAPRDAKNQTEWALLTGYSDWRGRHLFLDTQLTAGYGDFRGKRFLDLTIPTGTSIASVHREADSKRAGLLAAGGMTTGVVFNWGSTLLMPQVSVDGLILREEGYTEKGGGDGFNLQVQPYYANSLRTFLGADLRQDLDLGIFTLQPEARLGYRFDFLNDPVKIKGAFAVDPTDTAFTLRGPDPTRGNVVAGATIGASTDTWSMGVNFDWVRGSNGSTTEVGTLSLLGRI